MKRPLALIGFTFLAILVALGLYGEGLVVFILPLAAVIAALMLVFRKRLKSYTQAAACLSAAAACVFFSVFTQFSYVAAMALTGENIEIEGRINNLPEKKYGNYYYEIQTLRIGDKNFKTKIRLMRKELLDAEPYDEIKACVTLYSLGSGSAESVRHHKANSVYLGAYTNNEIEVKPNEGRHPFYYILKFREFVLQRISGTVSSESGHLLSGMLLGERSGLSAKTERDFRDSGISHLLAVSGSHVTVWSVTAFNFLNRMKLKKRASAAFAVLFTLFFMVLAGFTPSVVRSCIMSMTLFAGFIFKRESDSLNSLGLALIIILCINPFAALDIGLLLSFLATWGILVFQPALMVRVNRFTNRIKPALLRKASSFITQAVCITFSATIFTLPVNILCLGRLSLIAPLTNILTVEPSMFAVVPAMLGAVLSAIPFLGFLSNLLFFAAGITAGYILFAADLMASIPYASVSVEAAYVTICFAGTLIMMAFVAIKKNNRTRLYLLTSLLSFCVLLTGVFSHNILNSRLTKINVAAVGDGFSAVITRGRRVALIACGGSHYNTAGKIMELIDETGAREIDFILIPRLKNSEYSALKEISAVYEIKNLIAPELNDVIDSTRAKEKTIGRDLQINIWDDVSMRYKNSGDGSLVQLDAAGFKTLMSFTPTMDIDSFPEAFKDSKIIISRADFPLKTEHKPFLYGILSVEEDDDECISHKGMPVMYTGTDKNIAVSIRDKERFEIRRQ